MKFTKKEVDKKMKEDKDDGGRKPVGIKYGTMAQLSTITMILSSLAAGAAGDWWLRLLLKGTFRVLPLIIWIGMTASAGLALYCIRWYMRKKKQALAFSGYYRMREVNDIINRDIRKLGAYIITAAGLYAVTLGLTVPNATFFSKNSIVRRYPLSFVLYPILLIVLGEFYIYQGSQSKRKKTRKGGESA